MMTFTSDVILRLEFKYCPSAGLHCVSDLKNVPCVSGRLLCCSQGIFFFRQGSSVADRLTAMLGGSN